MKRYQKHMKSRARKALNESKDCGVIATAIVARITYKAAHALLKDAGREDRHGTCNIDTATVIRGLGFTMTNVNQRQPNGHRYTPKTVGERYPRGYYLCWCSGHVFAMVNGVVEDWTNDRQHHIYEIVKIVRKR